MSKRKQVKEPCPFCGGTMTPIYNGNTERLVIHSWECSRASCQFNSEYFGDNALEHRNYKKIKKMQNRITELEFDNRSLVEQMNKMALKPNQAVIEYFYPKYNPITKRLENLPTKECPCIVELYSGEYEIVWWISAGFEETGWDGYCVDEVKSWAYLPKGVTNE